MKNRSLTILFLSLVVGIMFTLAAPGMARAWFEASDPPNYASINNDGDIMWCEFDGSLNGEIFKNGVSEAYLGWGLDIGNTDTGDAYSYGKYDGNTIEVYTSADHINPIWSDQNEYFWGHTSISDYGVAWSATWTDPDGEKEMYVYVDGARIAPKGWCPNICDNGDVYYLKQAREYEWWQIWKAEPPYATENHTQLTNDEDIDKWGLGCNNHGDCAWKEITDPEEPYNEPPYCHRIYYSTNTNLGNRDEYVILSSESQDWPYNPDLNDSGMAVLTKYNTPDGENNPHPDATRDKRIFSTDATADYDNDKRADFSDWSWEENDPNPDDQIIGVYEMQKVLDYMWQPPPRPDMDHDDDGFVGVGEMQHIQDYFYENQNEW